MTTATSPTKGADDLAIIGLERPHLFSHIPYLALVAALEIAREQIDECDVEDLHAYGVGIDTPEQQATFTDTITRVLTELARAR